MAKPGPSTSARKPPEPSDSHAEIADWAGRVMPDLQAIVALLDDTVRDTIPGLQYAVKWKKAYYGLPKVGWVIEMVAYDISVNLVFFDGASFDNPPPLGSDGQSRYVKVKSLDEARAPEIRKWIEQAGKARGWQ